MPEKIHQNDFMSDRDSFINESSKSGIMDLASQFANGEIESDAMLNRYKGIKSTKKLISKGNNKESIRSVDYVRNRNTYIIDKTKNDLAYVLDRSRREELPDEVLFYEIGRIANELEIYIQSEDNNAAKEAANLLRSVAEEADKDIAQSVGTKIIMEIYPEIEKANSSAQA